MPKSVIVAGASPEALICAAYLAKAGNAVHLVDPLPSVGGRYSCLDHDSCTIPRSPMPLSGLEQDMPLGAILAELGISAPVYELHGEMQFLDVSNGFRLSLDTDPASNDRTAGNDTFSRLHEMARNTWTGLMRFTPQECEPFTWNALLPDTSVLPDLNPNLLRAARTLAALNGLSDASTASASSMDLLLALNQMQEPLFLPDRTVCALMNAFGELLRLFNAKVHLGQSVTSITTSGSSWSVTFGSNTLEADALVIGIRPDKALPLFNESLASVVEPFIAPTANRLVVHLTHDHDVDHLPMYTVLTPPEPLAQSIKGLMAVIHDDDLCTGDAKVLSLECCGDFSEDAVPDLIDELITFVTDTLLACGPDGCTLMEHEFLPEARSSQPLTHFLRTGLSYDLNLAFAGPWNASQNLFQASALLARYAGLALCNRLD